MVYCRAGALESRTPDHLHLHLGDEFYPRRNNRIQNMVDCNLHIDLFWRSVRVGGLVVLTVKTKTLKDEDLRVVDFGDDLVLHLVLYCPSETDRRGRIFNSEILHYR